MFVFLAFMELSAFPERNNALLNVEKNLKDVKVQSSGSIGFYKSGKCVPTYPNQTLGRDDPRSDWCSNLAKSKDDNPWISYSLKNKRVSLTGYSIRSGCCYSTCCCIDDSSYIPNCCCCELYSFSLQGSTDNITWETIHSVVKERDLEYCAHRTYDFPKTKQYSYVRLLLDEPRPGCDSCMAINKIELYGESVDYIFSDSMIDDETEDTISIIGKVRKSED